MYVIHLTYIMNILEIIPTHNNHTLCHMLNIYYEYTGNYTYTINNHKLCNMLNMFYKYSMPAISISKLT